MFHVHNDEVRQRAHRFRVQKGVADQQNPGMAARRLEDCIYNLSYIQGGEDTKFESVSRGKSRSIDGDLFSNGQRMTRKQECSKQVAECSHISQCFYIRSHRVYVNMRSVQF